MALEEGLERNNTQAVGTFRRGNGGVVGGNGGTEEFESVITLKSIRKEGKEKKKKTTCCK